MKRLSLKRDVLVALTTDELAGLAGGNSQDCGPQPTPPVYAPRTIPLDECFATTQDSRVVCTGRTYDSNCSCVV